jgi:hypothetical protein
MLARATAAAAGVPLIYCSGSDFVEMYVTVEILRRGNSKLVFLLAWILL